MYRCSCGENRKSDTLNIKDFTSKKANLHPRGIFNLEMGYIFEKIIRKLSESHNEDARQHYTPREVIELMVNILFYDDNDILSGNNVAKTIYEIILPNLIQGIGKIKRYALAV